MKGIVQFLKENKPYPREDESVLHYLVCTENRDFESAIRCLPMAVREWHGISKLALGISSATFLISLLSAASGVGAWVALSLVSSIFTGTQAWGSRRESFVREKELELLKSHPELLELMHQAYSKGVPALKLVHSYNAIVGAFDTSSGTCQGTMPVQAFAGQMQGAIATAALVHQALGQLDIASLPESKLYPHLTENKPSLPPGQPSQPQAQPDGPKESAPIAEPALPIPEQPISSAVFSPESPDLHEGGARPETNARGAIEVRTPDTKKDKALPPFDRERIINESKGLMIIGDMGAAKTCVAQHIANGFLGYGIIVFDPHGKTDWGNAYIITKMAAIYRQMAILLDLLENGDETPLLVICDEWLEIRGDRRNKEKGDYKGLADDFIRLFSTKPRKFNKLAGFVLHSPNVEAAGVDSFLRENYLKIYLGRLAKKEFPHIQDCAYPCVLEDEQQEHPTHGHHTEFKPKGKVPRHLQPLTSAPIDIPLAYMDGTAVRVCVRGWADGQLRLDVGDIRRRLELLLDTRSDTGNDTSIDTDTSYQEEGIEGDTDDTNTSNSDTSIDSGNDTDTTETAEPRVNTCGSSGIGQVPDFGIDTSSDTSSDTEQYTPAKLSREQMLILIQHMQGRISQTQIIQDLWCVEKNKQGWKQAYAQFKELTGDT